MTHLLVADSLASHFRGFNTCILRQHARNPNGQKLALGRQKSRPICIKTGGGSGKEWLLFGFLFETVPQKIQHPHLLKTWMFLQLKGDLKTVLPFAFHKPSNRF